MRQDPISRESSTGDSIPLLPAGGSPREPRLGAVGGADQEQVPSRGSRESETGLRFVVAARQAFWNSEPLGINHNAHFDVLRALHDSS